MKENKDDFGGVYDHQGESGLYSNKKMKKLNAGCLIALGVFIALLIWAIFLTKQIW